MVLKLDKFSDFSTYTFDIIFSCNSATRSVCVPNGQRIAIDSHIQPPFGIEGVPIEGKIQVFSIEQVRLNKEASKGRD